MMSKMEGCKFLHLHTLLHLSEMCFIEHYFDKFHCPWFLCFLNVRNWNAKKKCIKVFYWSDGKAKSVQLSTLVGWRVFSMLVFLYFAFSFIANGFLKFFLILWKSFFLKNDEMNNWKIKQRHCPFASFFSQKEMTINWLCICWI